jgi:15-cis-phytoene desaturase
MKSGTTVVVMGAGLAGLSTAIHLAKSGLRVRVLEKDDERLGGRASSVSTPDGDRIDYGLHVFCRHYLNLLSAMSEAGIAEEAIEWFHETGYISSDGSVRATSLDPLPSPLHLTRFLLSSPYPVKNRMRGAMAGIVVALRGDAGLGREDGRTYESWSNVNGLGPGMLAFGNAGCDASTFLPADKVSAKPVLSWMKNLLRNSSASDIGVLRGTLGEALIRPLAALAERHGATILRGTRVERIAHDGRRVVGVATSGGSGNRTFEADHYVSALPVEALQAVLGGGMPDSEYFRRIARIQTVPATCVVVWFDRPIPGMGGGPVLVESGLVRDFKDVTSLNPSAVAGRGSVVQFLLSRPPGRSQSDRELVDTVVGEFAALWPGARGASPTKTSVLRIPHAMYAAYPGVDALRPAQRSPMENLFLAGDWTRQDLNACMEGAFVSGMLAADAILRSEKLGSVDIRQVSDEPLLRVSQMLFGPLLGG